MKLEYFNSFDKAIDFVREKLITEGYTVRTEKWQGIPLMHDMWETLNTSFKVFMPSNTTTLVPTIKPNLPWADIHFEERVGGLPLNPGESYKQWPFYKMDKQMRTEGEKFSHTYMERIWPKYCLAPNPGNIDPYFDKPLRGIRYDYGDFDDVVNLLTKEPYTRQAFLPLWFPEDTGVIHGGRVPCTIGYHFIRRDNYLHVVYYIRSCDYLRHFRDDIYLAVLKVLWLIHRLKEIDPSNWENVKPGIYTMHITSLHIFQNEVELVKRFKK